MWRRSATACPRSASPRPATPRTPWPSWGCWRSPCSPASPCSRCTSTLGRSPSGNPSVISQIAASVFGGARGPVLPLPGRHRRHPHPRRQHRVQRLPGAVLDPRRTPLPAPPAAQPRRQAGLQQRHHPARRVRDRVDRRLRRQHRQAHPALHHRRVHQLHPQPSRHGPALEPHHPAQPTRAPAADADLPAHQRPRRPVHRGRARHRPVHQGRPRRLARHPGHDRPVRDDESASAATTMRSPPNSTSPKPPGRCCRPATTPSCSSRGCTCRPCAPSPTPKQPGPAPSSRSPSKSTTTTPPGCCSNGARTKSTSPSSSSTRPTGRSPDPSSTTSAGSAPAQPPRRRHRLHPRIRRRPMVGTTAAQPKRPATQNPAAIRTRRHGHQRALATTLHPPPGPIHTDHHHRRPPAQTKPSNRAPPKPNPDESRRDSGPVSASDARRCRRVSRTRTAARCRARPAGCSPPGPRRVRAARRPTDGHPATRGCGAGRRRPRAPRFVVALPLLIAFRLARRPATKIA